MITDLIIDYLHFYLFNITSHLIIIKLNHSIIKSWKYIKFISGCPERIEATAMRWLVTWYIRCTQKGNKGNMCVCCCMVVFLEWQLAPFFLSSCLANPQRRYQNKIHDNISDWTILFCFNSSWNSNLKLTIKKNWSSVNKSGDIL